DLTLCGSHLRSSGADVRPDSLDWLKPRRLSPFYPRAAAHDRRIHPRVSSGGELVETGPYGQLRAGHSAPYRPGCAWHRRTNDGRHAVVRGREADLCRRWNPARRALLERRPIDPTTRSTRRHSGGIAAVRARSDWCTASANRRLHVDADVSPGAA